MNPQEFLAALKMMSESENPFAKELVRRNSGGMMVAPNPMYPAIQNLLNLYNQRRNVNTIPPGQQYMNSAQYKRNLMQGYPTF